MTAENKAPLPEHTKNDSSDVERVKQDNQRLGKDAQNTPAAPPEPAATKEEEEAEKGHS